MFYFSLSYFNSLLYAVTSTENLSIYILLAEMIKQIYKTMQAPTPPVFCSKKKNY